MTRTAKEQPVSASVNTALRRKAEVMAKPQSGSSQMYRLVFGETKPVSSASRGTTRRVNG